MRFELCRRNGGWRWKLVTRNGRELAQSTPIYRNRQDCIAAIEMVKSTSAGTEIDEVADCDFAEVV